MKKISIVKKENNEVYFYTSVEGPLLLRGYSYTNKGVRSIRGSVWDGDTFLGGKSIELPGEEPDREAVLVVAKKAMEEAANNLEKMAKMLKTRGGELR